MSRSVRIWTWPIIVATATAVGLISALLADGWADALAWFGLGLPGMVACVHVLRAIAVPKPKSPR